MLRSTHCLALATFLWSAAAAAHAGKHDEGVTHDPETGEHVEGEARTATPKREKGPFSKGRVVFRGGASLDLNRSINLGGENEGGAAITGGLNAGAGYFVIDNLSLDLDLQARFQLSAPPGVHSLGLTPGARYQFIPQAYVRAGVPLIFLPEFGLGVLGGAGYHQPLGRRAALVVGVDYTYYLTENYRRSAPLGKLDVHAGVQTWF